MNITNPSGAPLPPDQHVQQYFGDPSDVTAQASGVETVDDAARIIGDDTTLYGMYMMLVWIASEEQDAMAMLLLRQVNAANEKLNTYNEILALLQANTNKDGDVDLNAIFCPPPNDSQSLASWLQENEPEIYSAVSKGSSFFDKTKMDTLITSLQSKIETFGTEIQTLMIQIQDHMGKADDYSASAKTAIDWMERALGAIIGGIR